MTLADVRDYIAFSEYYRASKGSYGETGCETG